MMPLLPTPTIALFANPSAGQGRAIHVLNGLVHRLRILGIEAVALTTHPELLTPEQFPDRITLVVIIGGDGTVRSVVERLRQIRSTLPEILVVSMGTANLISQHLKLDWQTHIGDRVMETILRHRICPLDAALANGHLCLMMASAGFDAHVVHELAQQRRGPIDMLDYILPALKTLATMRFTPVVVTVDGRAVFDGPAMVVVANLDVYGTGFPMALHARPDDGLLDVCVLPMRSMFDVVEVAVNAFVGEHLLREGVVYATGKHIHITSHQPVAVQVDGDAFGFTPLEVSVLKEKIPFVARE